MVGKVFYMMTEMEQAVETLLGLRRQIESQLDNMVVDVIAGDTDKGYLDRKKRYFATKNRQRVLYFI